VNVGYSAEEVALLLKNLVPSVPPPAFSDLFEVIHEPEDVLPAIFRTGRNAAVAPYDVPHIRGRVNTADIQRALEDALFHSGGALLVKSLAGRGKTREVGELAVALCSEGWTICVARSEGDSRIDTPTHYPEELWDRRILFVLDDLHRRTGAGVKDQKRYVDRLESFVRFFEGKVAPGDVYVIATARSEPHHWRQVDHDLTHPLWSRFRLYELPDFSMRGLRSMLIEVGHRMGVDVDPNLAERLVANSDRTPRTLVLNVERAAQRGGSLLEEHWFPTQRGSWQARFREARSRWDTADEVCQALHVIHEAGLPTRMGYVAGLASDLAGADASAAAEGLVDMGLLGIRGGVLDAYADEQLQDGLRNVDRVLPSFADHWEAVRGIVRDSVKQRVDGIDDLVPLAIGLAGLERWAEAEADLSTAIDGGKRSAEVYFWRGAVRGLLRDGAGAEADCTTALELGEDGAHVYSARGWARDEQEDWSGAEADYSAAIERGREDAHVYRWRSRVRFFLEDWPGVEVDCTRAIRLGSDEAGMYLTRARARAEQEDWAGAEADFTAAIECGSDHAGVYTSRAEARIQLEDWRGAEADCTAAIGRGREDAFIYTLRGWTRRWLEVWTGAEADFTAAIERGRDDAEVYSWRAGVRFHAKKWAEVEADHTAAIVRGRDDAQVYSARGFARLTLEDHAGAEADLTAAIERGRDDAGDFLLRAGLRTKLEDWSGAEADYTAAIERGRDGADVYFRRSRVRTELRDEVGAAADFSVAVERGEADAEQAECPQRM
jgi:tetratricopeptide (TPR) repeat protein